MRDPEEVVPDISEIDINTMTPEQERELVMDMRRDENMAKWYEKNRDFLYRTEADDYKNEE